MTSVVETKKSYHHGDLRAQLLEAVRDLVESHGPDGFSVSEACRRAGVSTAAPYKHFKDRDAILRGVALGGMDRLREAMVVAAADETEASRGAVSAMGQAYIDFARAEPGVFRLMFGLTEAHADDAEIAERGGRCYGVLLDAVARYLGCAPDDVTVRRRGYMLWCFVHGHAFLNIDHKVKPANMSMSEREYLDEIARRVLDD